MNRRGGAASHSPAIAKLHSATGEHLTPQYTVLYSMAARSGCITTMTLNSCVACLVQSKVA